MLTAASAVAQRRPPRLDRANLLVYLDGNDRPAPVRTVRDWLKRRADIVRGMQEIMGPFPGTTKRCPLEVKIEDEVDAGSHIRRLISYASELGGRVPAYLLIPKPLLGGGRKAHAVLCLHQTDNRFGHKSVVGIDGRSELWYALELAERGFVTLAPSYPLLANYQPDLKALGWRSGTMKAIWDNVRGMDVLDTLPFVRRGSYGAIGHSLGGHNSVYTAVFDARIKVVISSCGLDSYLDYKDGDIKGWTSERYMPKLLEYQTRLDQIPFDFHEMIGALAPRACLLIAPLKDSNFKWESVDRVAAAAREIYKLYGKPENLRVEHPDCGHEFPRDMRMSAYSLLERQLAG